MTDKARELKYAEFFCGVINNSYGRDYIAEPNYLENEKDPEIDVYAKSIREDTVLGLQMKNGDPEMAALWASLRKQARQTKSSASGGVTRGITSVVESALSKRYEPKAASDLILVIESEYFPPVLPDDAEWFHSLFSRFFQNDYKGVFLVLLPRSDGRAGQILAIKNCFGSEWLLPV